MWIRWKVYPVVGLVMPPTVPMFQMWVPQRWSSGRSSMGIAPVLAALDRDVPGAERVEPSTDLTVVECLRTRLEREHRVLDEGAVGLLGKDVEERGAVVLRRVEVHEGDHGGVEHRPLGPDLPAAEVLAQRMSDGGSVRVRRETGALEHHRGAQLALGEFDHARITFIADPDDVLGDEAHVGPFASYVEDRLVVVASTHSCVRAPWGLAGPVRTTKLLRRLPCAEPHPDLIPGSVGQVCERGRWCPPECPCSVVDRFEVAVDHHDAPISPCASQGMPERAQAGAAGPGDDEIGVGHQ